MLSVRADRIGPQSRTGPGSVQAKERSHHSVDMCCNGSFLFLPQIDGPAPPY